MKITFELDEKKFKNRIYIRNENADGKGAWYTNNAHM